ncbi:branchpoint-bridging protein-like [Amphibalanus amphitrite]|uniref:branchpoint-bridging protein-like n=1 Tax=Amphibalanus amphitrite TaxID=1232801 RepID=UPI001C91D3AD|nr:branchpoint-bridging protein-like [Amphibalanus amphitrite]
MTDEGSGRDPNMAQPTANPSATPIAAMLPRLAPPRLDLSTDRGESFRAWRARWDDFALLSGLAAQPPAVQMAVLRSCVSDEAVKVIANFALSASDRTDLAVVLSHLEAHAVGQVNPVLQRRAFHLRCQHEGESFDDFLTALRDLSRSCGFCDDCGESLLRDRVVVGLRDPETVRKLCAIPNLSLTEAVRVCRAEETSSRAVEDIVGVSVAACRAPAGARRGRRQHGGFGGQSAGRFQDGGRQVAAACGKCGRGAHRRDGECPARGRRCYRCGSSGHFSIVCRSQEAPDRRGEKTASAVTVASLSRGTVSGPRLGSKQYPQQLPARAPAVCRTSAGDRTSPVTSPPPVPPRSATSTPDQASTRAAVPPSVTRRPTRPVPFRAGPPHSERPVAGPPHSERPATGERPAPSSTRPVPPSTRPVPSSTRPVPPSTRPVPSSTRPVPPSTRPVPPSTRPVPPSTRPVPRSTRPVPPSTRPVHLSARPARHERPAPPRARPAPGEQPECVLSGSPLAADLELAEDDPAISVSPVALDEAPTRPFQHQCADL